jgi:hypothetical protein
MKRERRSTFIVLTAVLTHNLPKET